MTAKLVGNEVLVEDQAEASQIHNKGYYGVPQTGGGLKLDLMEAIYLVESERLDVHSDEEKLSASDELAQGRVTRLLRSSI